MAIANKYCQNFSVGDIVTVRDWKDMEKEFGLDDDGDISLCGLYFLTTMIECCGLDFEVDGINDSGFYTLSPVDTRFEGCIRGHWCFEDAMLYEKDDENSEVGEQLSEFLLSIMK